MATKYWKGDAPAVAQVGTVQVTAYDAATTYKLTIGGVVVSVLGTTNVNTTAAALAAAAAASSHPYFTAIAWSVITDTITATAGTEGVPFTVTSSVSGGTGTIGAYTAVTANSGPNDWSTVANWSDGAIPANGDTVHLKDNGVDICWGLAQSGVALAAFIKEKTYTGRIGLAWHTFAITSNGRSATEEATEYRATYLAIGSSSFRGDEYYGSGNPTGSDRVKIDFGSATACTIEIFGGHTTPAEVGLEVYRIKAVHASTDVFVRGGSLGVARDVPGETSTIRKLVVTGGKGAVGAGVTWTTFQQNDGTAVVNAAAALTTATINGGTTKIEGDFPITTMNVNGGTVTDSHVSTGSGAACTTVNIRGGSLDTTKQPRTRTYTTVNFEKGIFDAEAGVLTVGTLNVPTNRRYTLKAE